MLVMFTTIFHYESLRMLSSVLSDSILPRRARVLAAVLGTFVAHICEIAVYGGSYYFLRDRFGLGNFVGNFTDSLSTFMYFSAETYTSVGFGDIFPTGSLRLVCGLEALNGLLLIG